MKEETFIQTDRRGGDGQLGWRGPTASHRLEDWGERGCGWQSHIMCADKPGGRDNWGVRQSTQHRVPAQEKKASKPLAGKT